MTDNTTTETPADRAEGYGEGRSATEAHSGAEPPPGWAYVAAVHQLTSLLQSIYPLLHDEDDSPLALAVGRVEAEQAKLTPAGIRMDGELSEQWSVRKSSVPEGESVGLPANSRDAAEWDRDRWLAHDRTYPVTAELVRREVRRWSDGSVFVGAWVRAEREV